MPDLYDVADQQRHAVLAQERAAALELIRAWGKAWAAVRERLAVLTAQIDAARDAGEEMAVSWLYERNRLAVLERQILAEMAPLIGFADETIRQAQFTAVTMAAAHGAELLTLATVGTPIAGSFALLLSGAVTSLVGFLSNGSPLRALLDGLGPDASQRIRDVLITGLATGQSTSEMARQARAAFGGNMARVLTVSRTETMRAYNRAAQLNYQESGVVRGWRWLATKSARTCPNCLSRDGRFYPLDKPLPAHVNCRCRSVPVLRSIPEPERETAGEWFERQDNDVQRQVLGPAAFNAFKAGRVKLRSFEGLRHDPEWGDVTYARSLKQILGGEEAGKWARAV